MATSLSSASRPRVGAADAPLWAACAAAALVPWTIAPGLRDAWTLPKCAVAAALASVGAAGWALAGAPSLALGLEAPAALFLSAVVLSACLAADPLVSWLGPDLEPAVGVVGAAAAAAGLYLGAAAGRLRADASASLSRVLAAAAAPMGLWAVWQASVHPSTGWLAADPGMLGRATGGFGHPVAFGAYLAVAAPNALSWALGAEGWAGRGAALLCLAAIALGLDAAGSRAALAAAAAACALVLFFDRRPHARRAAAAALALGLVGGALLTVRTMSTGARSSGRLAAFATAREAFAERPAAGWGPGSFSFLYRARRTARMAMAETAKVSFPHAHNDWLEVLCATGLLGGAAYAWLHARALAAARRSAGPAAAAGLGGALALFLVSKVNIPGVPATFLGALALGAALAASPFAGAGRAASGGLFVASCLLALGLSASRLPSERSDHLGRAARAGGAPREAAERFEAAVAGAPGVVAFRLDLMNLLWDLAGPAPAAERDLFLGRARDVALEGARLRPLEPDFMRLLGVAELRRAEAGADSLRAARAALEAARAADPFSPLTVSALADATALEGRRGRTP